MYIRSSANELIILSEHKHRTYKEQKMFKNEQAHKTVLDIFDNVPLTLKILKRQIFRRHKKTKNIKNFAKCFVITKYLTIIVKHCSQYILFLLSYNKCIDLT